MIPRHWTWNRRLDRAHRLQPNLDMTVMNGRDLANMRHLNKRAEKTRRGFRQALRAHLPRMSFRKQF